MASALTASFPAYNCETVAGGMSEVYVLLYSDFVSITETAGSVSAIDDGAASWAKYGLTEEVGEMKTDEMKDIKNNSLFYNAMCNFTMAKLSTAKRTELAILVTQRCVLIGKANDGTYWLMGWQNGAHKAGTNGSSLGTAFGDLNGNAMGFVAKQTQDLIEVDSAVITGLTFY